MKKVLFVFTILVLFLSASLVYACCEQPTKIEKMQTNNLEVVKLKVEGIYCSGCIPIIKNALQKNPDVKKAEVNLQGEAKVYAIKGKVEPKDLIKAIEQAGYKAKPVKGTNGN